MATKSIEDIEQWIEKRQKCASVVQFLAVKKNVQELLEKGYPVKTIWEYLSEKEHISFGYTTFRNHVNKHIKKQGATRTSPLPEKTQTQKAPEPKTRNKEDDEHEPVIVRTNFESKGFRHDPAGARRLEDLFK